jgi:hypothetical protein
MSDTIYTFQHLTAATDLATDDEMIVFDTSAGRTKSASVSEVIRAAGGPGVVKLFDDFLGDVIEDGWSAAEGNDDLAVIAAINSQPNGVVRQVTGDTVTLSESGVSLTHGLNWRASNGGLVFEARIIPITSVASVRYFVGLTDTLATTTLEIPATLSTTTITYVADNAVGWLFDTAATTDVFYGVGVKATSGVAFASAVVGSAPVADTAMVLRIEVSSTGTASFYQDGTLKGTMANAVTSTTQLTPIVCAMTATTASKTLDVDYIFCQQNRA